MSVTLGTSPSAGVPAGVHVCGTFISEGERRAVVEPFLRRGLGRDERLVYVADPGRASDVVTLLRGLDLNGGAGSPVELWSTDDLYRPSGRFDPDRVVAGLRDEVSRTLASGYSALRVVAEMPAAGRSVPPQVLAAYERAVSNVTAECALAALCQYDQRVMPRALLDTGAVTHPLVAQPRSSTHQPLWCKPAGPRVRVGGEVDADSAKHFAVLLREHLPGSGDLHLDLATLRFIDLTGARTLCQLGLELSPDRRVVLHRPPTSVLRCLSLMDSPGVVVEDESA